MHDLVARVSRRAALRREAAPSHLRVAARYLRAYLSPKTDLVARMQMLEGAAGVPRGAWTRRLVPAEARGYFGDDIASEWTDRSETGLANAAVEAVRKNIGERDTPGAIRSKLRDMSADEMVNSFIGGLWPWPGPSGDHTIMAAPPFYAIGQKMDEATKQGISAGTVKPKDFVRIVYSWVQQKARSELKKWMRAVGRGKGHETEWLPSGGSRFEVMETEVDQTSVLTRILGQKNNPTARRIRRLLRDIADENPRRADAEVFLQFLDIIEGMSGGEARTEFGRLDQYGVPRGVAKTIADRIGKSRQFVGQALKRAFAFVVDRAQRKPQLRRLWEEIASAEAMAGTRAASDEFVADLEAWADECLSALEYEADRSVNVGPLTLTYGKFPGAQHGAYK